MYKTTIESIIKKQLKEDLPKLNLIRVKLETLGINYITFWYNSEEYKYDFYSQILSYVNLTTKENLRKEFI